MILSKLTSFSQMYFGFQSVIKIKGWTAESLQGSGLLKNYGNKRPNVQNQNIGSLINTNLLVLSIQNSNF